ncbi:MULTISPECIES: Rrf2 family transcriptional regulator [unclassified Kosmotoga]|jgi:Rrf2 family protein|uniref:RrF2 family transcriptional regulator n=1 Tax=unclassified Kosmotoga TaxID=2631489 RepID=UPI0007C470FB|nr:MULTISPECIES: Rrf2 family transcriptional regulator [unclassified Kosmotoga]MDI3523367.1 Rrf2 family transcriptional regulator, iron-sulfur cluster assembly transcription factor [Kosmotoga sp.]MDK2952865.1 Rrf2 family transcriptional regulator, iron-sulfur cluster assembly transcription factor [Kosmotoga sp.]OAA19898.1 Rrf2 family transcriptional regulator [Kosmotoga sp. DU53]
MGFTVKSSYALRALYELALAAESGNPKLSLAKIAERDMIPRDFLEKIFAELRDAGFVKATRGRYGGYVLAKPANEIYLRDVILKLDKPMNSYVCVRENTECDIDPNCTVKYVWFRLYNSMMRELGKMTLADLIEIGEKLKKNKRVELQLEEKPETGESR